MIETVLGFFEGRMIGVAGVFAILAIAILFSKNRLAINFRIVLSAFALQAAIALFVLRTPFGIEFIKTLSTGVTTILSYAKEGIGMIFGGLAGDDYGTVFAIHVLPVIIFFSALMSVLYHMRIMQAVVAGVGGFFEHSRRHASG